MAALRKPVLLGRFEDALRASGLSLLKLADGQEHPASYQIMGPSYSRRVRVYIWKLTSGGRPPLPDEWRIQVTGLQEIDGSQRFVPDLEGQTVILGWCEDFEVFAAWDISKHSGALGASASIQIRQPALEAARIDGLAPHFKGDAEVAFAVQPAYMGAYLDNQEGLHACGSSEEALSLLEEICKNPQEITDSDIASQLPEPRRYAVVATRKALRDANFKDRVLTAYSNACAMCGIQLRLLDAAHILPAAHPDSTDETSNGVALCALHHRAYDRALVTFDAGYRVHRNETMEQEFVASGLDGGLADFGTRLFPVIRVPPAHADRPAADYIERVNALRGWDL